MEKTIAQLEDEATAAWNAFAEGLQRTMIAVAENRAAVAVIETGNTRDAQAKYVKAVRAIAFAQVQERVKRIVWMDDFGNDLINLTDINAALDDLKSP